MYTTDSDSYRAACELHPGDVVQQLDWSLHVRAVAPGPVEVVISVAEFEFPLHYASDARIRLAA